MRPAGVRSVEPPHKRQWYCLVDDVTIRFSLVPLILLPSHFLDSSEVVKVEVEVEVEDIVIARYLMLMMMISPSLSRRIALSG